MGYKHLAVEITPIQAKRAMKGGAIRIHPSQLGKGRLVAHPANVKKIEKAMLKNAGLTLELSPAELAETALYHINHNMDGSGLWSNIWKGLKKGWSFLKDSGIASKIADTAIPAAAAYLGQPQLAGPVRGAVKEIAGVGIKEDIVKHSKAAFGYAKRKGIISDALNLAEQELVKRKPEHEVVIKSVRAGIRKKTGMGVKAKKEKLKGMGLYLS